MDHRGLGKPGVPGAGWGLGKPALFGIFWLASRHLQATPLAVPAGYKLNTAEEARGEEGFSSSPKVSRLIM